MSSEVFTQPTLAEKFVSEGIFEYKSETAKTDYNTTDVINQPIRLYLEGVEVPFSSISISQVAGEFPTCELEIPFASGMTELARYYTPKVHVFFTEDHTGLDRLLFWGIITADGYTHSRSNNQGGTIHFRCEHRNSVTRSILLSYGGVLDNESKTAGENEAATTTMSDFNSITGIVRALGGINGVVSDAKDILSPNNTNVSQADINKLPADFAEFEQRLIGMPAVIVALWNGLKQTACATPSRRMNLLAMYIPLFEQGLSYLKRVSGHYLLEKQQQDSKIPYCPEGGSSQSIMVPPAYRNGSTSAVQSDMLVKSLQAGVGFSGEMSGFITLCEEFYQTIEYEILTLASPAEVNLDPTLELGNETPTKVAVETIVKPQIPFYYSPICNVVLPRMYDSIQVASDHQAVPSRLYAYHDALVRGPNQLTANYRGPNSVRESIAQGMERLDSLTGPTQGSKYNLGSTTGIDPNVPGMFEQGRGISPLRITIPPWLALMARNNAEVAGSPNQEQFGKEGTPEYNNYRLMVKSWQDRYGYDLNMEDNIISRKRNPDKDNMNPYSASSGIQPHERLLFAAVDYEFSKATSRARQGSLTGPFNPYIIPGYPMDVIGNSPKDPSYHGLCVSVNHTFTSRSISTSVNMAAVLTYTELSNYYQPPLHPWLQTALGLLNESTEGTPSTEGADGYGSTKGMKPVQSTILQNPIAKEKADQFYYSVLGVGAADPSQLVDISTGSPYPQVRVGPLLYASEDMDQKVPLPNGGEANDWLTFAGNLRSVSRPIESKDSIAAKFKYNFIDLMLENYGSTPVTYTNPVVEDPNPLEPGASMFLDYLETPIFLEYARQKYL